MKLTYQTGVATLIQFITLSFLGIANGVDSVVTTCRHDGSNCVSNLLVSLVFFILTALWFGLVWLLGYTAQERRSRRLAQLLIVSEAFIALIALFDTKHHTDALGLGTSLLDLALCVWIIVLAFRLMLAGNKRITTKPRARRRKDPTAK